MTINPKDDERRRLEQRRAELDQLVSEGKTNAEMVEFAVNPNTALHHDLDWDDTVAGAKWRIEQIKQLVRFVYTEMPGPNQEPMRVRAYFSVPSERGDGRYRHVADVLANPEWVAEVEAEYVQELKSIQRNRRMIAKLSSLYQRVEKVLEDVSA